jgi:membrane-associated phospholipid phosphatase
MALNNRKNIRRSIFGLCFRKTTLFFVVPFFVFLVLGGAGMLIFAKGSMVMALNSVSNEWLDDSSLFISTISHGSFLAVIALLLAFYKFRWSLLTMANLTWAAILTNLFKKVFFQLSSRPLHYFHYDDFPRFLYEAPLAYYYSFPSGHTMAVFAFCTMLTLLINRKSAGLILFVISFLGGLSRIYLLQHFFVDIWVGALLGVLVTVPTVWLDKKYALEERKFAERNVFSLFRKKTG